MCCSPPKESHSGSIEDLHLSCSSLDHAGPWGLQQERTGEHCRCMCQWAGLGRAILGFCFSLFVVWSLCTRPSQAQGQCVWVVGCVHPAATGGRAPPLVPICQPRHKCVQGGGVWPGHQDTGALLSSTDRPWETHLGLWRRDLALWPPLRLGQRCWTTLLVSVCALSEVVWQGARVSAGDRVRPAVMVTGTVRARTWGRGPGNPSQRDIWHLWHLAYLAFGSGGRVYGLWSARGSAAAILSSLRGSTWVADMRGALCGVWLGAGWGPAQSLLVPL